MGVGVRRERQVLQRQRGAHARRRVPSVRRRVAQQAVVVNGEAFARVAKDNLMPFPAKVVLGEAVRSDEEAVKAMTKYCGSEEAAAFAVALLKVSAR